MFIFFLEIILRENFLLLKALDIYYPSLVYLGQMHSQP